MWLQSDIFLWLQKIDWIWDCPGLVIFGSNQSSFQTNQMIVLILVKIPRWFLSKICCFLKNTIFPFLIDFIGGKCYYWPENSVQNARSGPLLWTKMVSDQNHGPETGLNNFRIKISNHGPISYRYSRLVWCAHYR